MTEPTADPMPRTTTAVERQEQLLRQLVRLTESVRSMAPRSAATTVDERPVPPVGVTRTRFAYAMLGELLGRHDPGFAVDRIDVEQGVANGERTLTFRSLKGGTSAHLAARDGSFRVLTGLVDDQRPVPTTVPGEIEIDLVVLLDDAGTAVGLAQCPETQRFEP